LRNSRSSFTQARSEAGRGGGGKMNLVPCKFKFRGFNGKLRERNSVGENYHLEEVDLNE